MVELEKLKESKGNEFDDLNDFNIKEITKWIFTFISINE